MSPKNSPTTTQRTRTPSSKLSPWQTGMNEAFGTFLAQTQDLMQTQECNLRPVLVSYVDNDQPESYTDKDKHTSKLHLPKAAQRLAAYLEQAGLAVAYHKLTTQSPIAPQVKALQAQLAQSLDQKLIVLCSPAYADLAQQEKGVLRQALVGYGKDKQDTVLPLACLGGISGVAAKILPKHFLFRNFASALRPFNGAKGGMPAFLNVFAPLSGQDGLGLLPDLLDLATQNHKHHSTYTAFFDALLHTQARLSVDDILEHALVAYTDPEKSLRAELPNLEALHTDIPPLVNPETAAEPDALVSITHQILENPTCQSALFLSRTAADTHLSTLALIDTLKTHPLNPRILVIDLGQYPGSAAHQSLKLALTHQLKLSEANQQALSHQTLDEATKARPSVIILKDYHRTSAYDNLIIQNQLTSWVNAKILITCESNHFERHDASLCFLADPASPNMGSFQTHYIAPFASDTAQASLGKHQSKPLQNLDALLANTGLSAKQRAQQRVLDRFLTRIKALRNQSDSKAFISYAWEPWGESRNRQQHHLRQLAKDLTHMGVDTWLDLEKMTGDIDAQMAQNIDQSDFALMIGTPLYSQRATEPDSRSGKITNVQKEYEAIIDRSNSGKLRILPLQYTPEGSIKSGQSAYPSFPASLPTDTQPWNWQQAPDDFAVYIEQLTHPNTGLLAGILALPENPEQASTYQAAYKQLQADLALLPAADLITQIATQDQPIYEIPQRRALYVEASARKQEKGKAKDNFGLTQAFDEFLHNPDHPAHTFVALGAGGSGKSLFSQIQYARLLEQWQAYQKPGARGKDEMQGKSERKTGVDNQVNEDFERTFNAADHFSSRSRQERPQWIPLYVQLKHYPGQAARTCVEAALKSHYKLDDADIAHLKAGSGVNLGILIILDGYDELGGDQPNLYLANNLSSFTHVKVLITSRVEYILRAKGLEVG